MAQQAAYAGTGRRKDSVARFWKKTSAAQAVGKAV